MAPVVKNPPAVQETLVSSLGEEDPLEKEMATHSSIPAWVTFYLEDNYNIVMVFAIHQQ